MVPPLLVGAVQLPWNLRAVFCSTWAPVQLLCFMDLEGIFWHCCCCCCFVSIFLLLCLHYLVFQCFPYFYCILNYLTDWSIKFSASYLSYSNLNYDREMLIMIFLLPCLIWKSDEISGTPDKLKFLLQMIWLEDSLILYTVAAFSLSSIFRSLLLSSACRAQRWEANIEQQQQQGLHKWLVSILVRDVLPSFGGRLKPPAHLVQHCFAVLFSALLC